MPPHSRRRRTDQPYNATFFSPPFLGVYDARDRLGDCAVGPTPQKRGSLQSSLYAGAIRLGIAGAAATPLVLALFSPRRPFKCQRKKWASIVSNMWCCQPAYFRTSYEFIPIKLLVAECEVHQEMMEGAAECPKRLQHGRK